MLSNQGSHNLKYMYETGKKSHSVLLTHIVYGIIIYTYLFTII